MHSSSTNNFNAHNTIINNNLKLTDNSSSRKLLHTDVCTPAKDTNNS